VAVAVVLSYTRVIQDAMGCIFPRAGLSEGRDSLKEGVVRAPEEHSNDRWARGFPNSANCGGVLFRHLPLTDPIPQQERKVPKWHL